jgi:EpsI family protein
VAIEGTITPGGDHSASGPASGGKPGSRLTRRHLLMGGALIAVSGLALARAPRRRYPNLTDQQFESMFPKAFGKWRTLPVSELVLPPESELANKMYQHIVTRTYVNDEGVAVMFLAAYNSEQLNNVQLHRPEFCYYASGFSIDKSVPLDLNIGGNDFIPARNVLATLGSRHENIIFWTRIGDEFPQSWAGQRIAMTKANLEGYLADGLLMRLSVVNPDGAQSVQQMTRFMTDMVAHASPRARSVVAGLASSTSV